MVYVLNSHNFTPTSFNNSVKYSFVQSHTLLLLMNDLLHLLNCSLYYFASPNRFHTENFLPRYSSYFDNRLSQWLLQKSYNEAV